MKTQRRKYEKLRNKYHEKFKKGRTIQTCENKNHKIF